MPNYSRKKYNQIKAENSECTDILLLPSDDLRTVFWTYDADAETLAELLRRRHSVSQKGPVITVTADDLEGYPIKAVDADRDAYYLHPGAAKKPKKADPWEAENDNLPRFALLRAKIIRGDRIESITVVSDEAEQDSESGVYWEDRTLSKKLIRALCMGSRFFLHKDVSYIILRVFYTEAYFETIEQKHHFLDISSEPKTIYVTDTSYFGDAAKYKPVRARFFYAGSSEPAEMTVFYSTAYDEYYIDKTTYAKFKEDYGLPYVRLEDPKSGSDESSELKEESDLSLYGYTVRQNTLSVQARRAILTRLVDCEIMTKGKIHDHLSFLISYNENNQNMINAREKWKEDLLFIDSYKKEDQKKIWAKDFVAKGSKPF